MRAKISILTNTPTHLVIVDQGPWDRYPTITNDAEAVVKFLFKQGLLTEGKRLYYYDSEGEFAQITLAGEEFTGFAPCEPTYTL